MIIGQDQEVGSAGIGMAHLEDLNGDRITGMTRLTVDHFCLSSHFSGDGEYGCDYVVFRAFGNDRVKIRSAPLRLVKVTYRIVGEDNGYNDFIGLRVGQ